MSPADLDAKEAAAWEDFTDGMGAPDFAREAFTRIVRPLIEAAERGTPAAILALAPFVHGDPRVDRWQTTESGCYPPERDPPEGFEPLAAWSVFHPSAMGALWERPLRRCDDPSREAWTTDLHRALVNAAPTLDVLGLGGLSALIASGIAAGHLRGPR